MQVVKEDDQDFDVLLDQILTKKNNKLVKLIVKTPEKIREFIHINLNFSQMFALKLFYNEEKDVYDKYDIYKDIKGKSLRKSNLRRTMQSVFNCKNHLQSQNSYNQTLLIYSFHS